MVAPTEKPECPPPHKRHDRTIGGFHCPARLDPCRVRNRGRRLRDPRCPSRVPTRTGALCYIADHVRYSLAQRWLIRRDRRRWCGRDPRHRPDRSCFNPRERLARQLVDLGRKVHLLRQIVLPDNADGDGRAIVRRGHDIILLGVGSKGRK